MMGVEEIENEMGQREVMKASTGQNLLMSLGSFPWKAAGEMS
jgi:hypothetical protein